MEFLKASRRKNVLSEVLHAVLNVALAVAVFALVTTGSAVLAFALVIVSKWRILAVRPRYWWANIQANIVDLTVSLGAVVLLYLAGTIANYGAEVQIGVAVLYAVWLIALKPRSSARWIVAQAAISLFVGTWALFATAHIISLAAVVIGVYVIGYGAAKHVIALREESQPNLLAMIFGLLVAEIAWAEYHWTVAYGGDAMAEFKVAQGALVIALIGFLAERLYALQVQSDTRPIRKAEAIIPSVFVVLIITVLVVIFSSGTGII